MNNMLQKGIVVIISGCLSFLKVLWLKILGFSLPIGTRVAWSSDFFQSIPGAISVGESVDVRRNTRINAGFNGKIIIGDRVLIDESTCVMAQHSIKIGDDCLIAPYCFIVDFNHAFKNPNKPINQQGYEGKPIVIEHDVWIGTHSVILAGVTIGKGAVVGAGSIVNRDVPAFTIVAGSPARVIGKRS